MTFISRRVATHRAITYNTSVAGPRVVLDTNVPVAALRSQRGASFRVLSEIGRGRYEFVLSVPLVLEYEQALMNARPSGVSPMDIQEVEYLRDRARRGDRRHFEQVLAKVPDVEPEETDRLPKNTLKPAALPRPRRRTRGQNR